MKNKKSIKQLAEALACGFIAVALFLCAFTLSESKEGKQGAGAETAAENHIASVGKMPASIPAEIVDTAPVAKADPEKSPEPMPETKPEPEATPAPAAETVAFYSVPLDHDLQLFIIGLCEEKHIAPTVIFGMIETESSFNAAAIGDGGAAFGLLQVHPQWHYERMNRLNCFNLLDPRQNVTVAVDYLSECIEYNGGNVEMGLVAYNAGQAGAEKGWFNNGVYSSDYSRKVLTAAQEIAEGAFADA